LRVLAGAERPGAGAYAWDVSFRFLATPKWLFWTAVVLVAVVVMGNLAGWQWARLQERRDANELVTARASLPVVAVGDATVTGSDPDDLEYRRVTATGEYLVGDEVLVANQTLRGAPGWWVVTPLRTADGTTVWVNRGWVPFASVAPDGPRDAFAPPPGTVTVTGQLLAGAEGEGASGGGDGVVARLDPVALAERLGPGTVPLWLRLEDQQPAQPTDEPVPVAAPALGDGPHLNYAGQWAIFASLTAVVFIVLVVRTAQRGGDGPGTARRRGAAAPTDPAVLTALAVRLAPLSGVDRLADVSGLPEEVVAGHLDELVATGAARHHAGEPSGWTLTPTGRDHLAANLATEINDPGVRAAIESAYRRFEQLNPVALAVCTDWQVRTDTPGGPVLNDHTDPAWDAAVMARLGEVWDAAAPLCDDLAAALARFEGYRGRLANAVERIRAGDSQWVDATGVDSFHTVWFELHEHLLATLGIPRGSGDASEPSGPGDPAATTGAIGSGGST
jgi:cytochrome oxidase assembly protein ShyY1